jgi:hypothetical protein
MLAPPLLASTIGGMLAKTPARLKVDMSGAANTARILHSMHQSLLLEEATG